MQAVLSIRYGDKASNMLGNYHEGDGNKKGQHSREENMDLWNNAVGREIAKEVKKEVKGMEKVYSSQQIEDMIAEKIMQKMKKGDLITNPFKDKRLFETSKYNGRIYTNEEIGKMSNDEFKGHEKHIDKDMAEGKILTKQQAEAKVKSGDLIYVAPYTRADGTDVKGYYRAK